MKLNTKVTGIISVENSDGTSNLNRIFDINGEGENGMLLVGKDVRKEQREENMWKAFEENMNLPGWKLNQQIVAAGKSFGMFNEWIPRLVTKHGVRVVTYMVTENTQKDVVGWREVISKSMKRFDTDEVGYYISVEENMTESSVRATYNKINDDDEYEYINVVINVVTDVAFCNYEGEYRRWLESLGNDICFIRDEFHAATSSDVEVTKANTGTRMDGYKSRFFNITYPFIRTTKHLYGVSATFNNEMLGNVKFGLGSEVYHDVGTPITPMSIKDQLKSLNGVEFYDMPTGLFFEQGYADYRGKIENFATDLVRNRELLDSQLKGYLNLPKINTKVTGIISVENSHSKKPSTTSSRAGVDPKFILERIQESDRMPIGIHWAIINSKEKTVYDSNGDYVRSIKGTEWVSKLEDPNDPLLFVVLQNVGATGTNVKNLTKALLLRNYAAEDHKGDRILLKIIQLYGRWNRVNRGGLSVKQWNSLPKEVRFLVYMTINTFDLVLRDHEHNQEAIREFKNTHAVRTVDVLGDI